MNVPLTLFEAFNARNLSPAEVAATFVPNQDFDQLWQNSHVVLMGPRGSGKTTLLKMLTLPALHSWQSDYAATVRGAIHYTAVYVPTDIHWHHQLRYVNERLTKNPEAAQAISQAAVTTNVLAALTNAFQDLLQYEHADQRAAEHSLCRLLVREWRLPETIPLLKAIRLALQARINEVFFIGNRLVYEGQQRELPEYWFLDYLAASAVACAGFEATLGMSQTKKWALCFDELELAPRWLQDRLFSELRSSDERFLFKLSTSPIPSLVSAAHASPRHDFSVIRLWPHRQKSHAQFCHELAKSVLHRRLGRSASPDILLGDSPLDREDYSRGSETWELLRDLAQTDDSFRTVLERHGINPDDPSTEDVQLRDKVLRKAKPIAIFRHALTKPGARGARLKRSRKEPNLYFGKQAVYEVSDGNPRWLIGILNDLLSRLPGGVADDVKPIPASVQARVLTQASRQFAALVRALPLNPDTHPKIMVDVYSLLSTVGEYFASLLIDQEFRLDPTGSFTVDEAVDDDVIELLKVAVYHGAVVLVDPEQSSMDSGVRGKRFRLSYLLAPMFRLPLRLYDAIPLSKCLGPDSQWHQRAFQRELFGGT